MNKDEMIEEMAKITNYTAFDFTQGTIQSKTIYTAMATALYNAGYRKVADDEIVIKESEYEALLLEQKRLKEIVDRIPCGYELKEITRQETARKILQELYSTPHEYHEKKIVDLAQKYGIELE